jgi:ABC-type branched-subunit amino acid transport system substrate-binding protein
MKTRTTVSLFLAVLFAAHCTQLSHHASIDGMAVEAIHESPLQFTPLSITFIPPSIHDTIQEAQTVYKRMADETRTFHGPEGRVVDPATLDSIDIGLFAPPEADHPAAGDFIRGAELAVEQANAGGGFRGVPFRLVRRWAGQPWAAGSKEVIRLVYQDKVWVIVAFRGGAGHIAQQIAAKAYVPVIAPLSSAVSLTSTGVSWIFRLPPDDNVQAQLMVKQGVVQKKLRRVGLVSAIDHDNRAAARAVEKAMAQQELPLLFHFKVASGLPDYRDVVQRVQQFRPDGLILCFGAKNIPRLIQSLARAGTACPLVLPWVPGVNPEELRAVSGGKLVMVQPFEISKAFCKVFLERYGASPGHSAVYAYDAVQMIVHSIKSRGLNRPALRRGLVELSGFKGVGGRIEWDNNGSNRSFPIFND